MGYGIMESIGQTDNVGNATRNLSGASQSFAAMDKKKPGPKEEKKSAGGALAATGSMAAAGATVGSMFPGYGTVIGGAVGAVVGLGSYLLS